MDIQVHGPSVGQNQFNTFFHVSVPNNVSYSDAERAISDFFYKDGYYGAHIDGKYSSEDGRQHFQVAAYKD